MIGSDRESVRSKGSLILEKQPETSFKSPTSATGLGSRASEGVMTTFPWIRLNPYTLSFIDYGCSKTVDLDTTRKRKLSALHRTGVRSRAPQGIMATIPWIMFNPYALSFIYSGCSNTEESVTTCERKLVSLHL
jgi:hypothetical protein